MILASARSLRARFAEAPELIRRELLGKLAVWAIMRELALHVKERARSSQEFPKWIRPLLYYSILHVSNRRAGVGALFKSLHRGLCDVF